MTCNNHNWPRNFALASNRSIGRIEMRECNNCLAVKIVTFTFDAKGRTESTTEQIVEPTNNRAYPR